MSYSAMPGYVPKNAELYFHRVKDGETAGEIAARYNVSAPNLMSSASTVQPKAGDMVVIDFKAGRMMVQ
jgi:LysM repeat protein